MTLISPEPNRLLRQILDLDPRDRAEVIGSVLDKMELEGRADRVWLSRARERLTARAAPAPGDEPGVDQPAGEDPIVEEIHRVGEELLDEFGGDIDALGDDTNRRLLNGEFGEVKLVRYPPRQPRFIPNPKLTDE